MKCFYHVDDDGKCAAFWVNNSALHYDEYTRDFFEINYGMKFPFELINANEQVIIVDYSISPDEMRKLLEITKDVTWIDHHITAIKKYENFETPIRGIRKNGIAGCLLTYCWFNHMTNKGCGTPKEFSEEMIEEAPYFTRLIADYDVWAFEFGDQTKYFHLGLETCDKDPIKNELTWMYFLGTPSAVMDCINKGKIIEQYRDNLAKEYCKSYGYDYWFEGFKCYIVNLGLCGSEHFKSVNADDYDVFIGYVYDGELYHISLRSTKVDVSQIALKYGGGGHAGAAGFETEQFLFEKRHMNMEEYVRGL